MAMSGGMGRHASVRTAASSPTSPMVVPSRHSRCLSQDSKRQYRSSPAPSASTFSPATAPTPGSSKCRTSAAMAPGARVLLASLSTTTGAVTLENPRLMAWALPSRSSAVTTVAPASSARDRRLDVGVGHHHDVERAGVAVGQDVAHLGPDALGLAVGGHEHRDGAATARDRETGAAPGAATPAPTTPGTARARSRRPPRGRQPSAWIVGPCLVVSSCSGPPCSDLVEFGGTESARHDEIHADRGRTHATPGAHRAGTRDRPPAPRGAPPRRSERRGEPGRGRPGPGPALLPALGATGRRQDRPGRGRRPLSGPGSRPPSGTNPRRPSTPAQASTRARSADS